MLSVVIPIHNEERAILRLYDRLTEVLEAYKALRDHLRRRRFDRPEF
jgi:curved DNA-binding protein CbpA